MGYRFYPLNTRNHIFGVEIIEAPDDDQAARLAEQLCRDRRLAGFELWDMARRITGQSAVEA